MLQKDVEMIKQGRIAFLPCEVLIGDSHRFQVFRS